MRCCPTPNVDVTAQDEVNPSRVSLFGSTLVDMQVRKSCSSPSLSLCLRSNTPGPRRLCPSRITSSAHPLFLLESLVYQRARCRRTSWISAAARRRTRRRRTSWMSRRRTRHRMTFWSVAAPALRLRLRLRLHLPLPWRLHWQLEGGGSGRCPSRGPWGVCRSGL